MSRLSFTIATTTIPNKDDRKPIEISAEELKGLLEAGLVRISPEFDGKIPGTTYHSREEILRFLADRPDRTVTKDDSSELEPEPTASGRRGC